MDVGTCGEHPGSPRIGRRFQNLTEFKRLFVATTSSHGYINIIDVEDDVTPFTYHINSETLINLFDANADCLSAIFEFNWIDEPEIVPPILSKINLTWNCKIELHYVDEDRARFPTKFRLFLYSNTEDNATILKMML